LRGQRVARGRFRDQRVVRVAERGLHGLLVADHDFGAARDGGVDVRLDGLQPDQRLQAGLRDTPDEGRGP
jgi:hypothetical protein